MPSREKDPLNTSKSNESLCKKHGTENGEEKLLKACVPTRTRDQTIILIFAKFLYTVLKALKKNDVTYGANPMPLCFLSHTMNVFSSTEHPMLLP